MEIIKKFCIFLIAVGFVQNAFADVCGADAKYGYPQIDCPKFKNADGVELQCSTGGRYPSSCYLPAQPMVGETYEDDTGYFVYTADCGYYPTLTLAPFVPMTPTDPDDFEDVEFEF